MTKSRKEGTIGKFALIACAIVLLDQLTKVLVVLSLQVNESVFTNPLFKIVLVQNKGAGFGILQGRTLLLQAVSIFVAAMIIIYYKRIKVYDRPFMAMILAGTVGNLIDRLIYGYVIDFISVSFFPPVWNVADSAITLGIVGLIYNMVRYEKLLKFI